MSFPSAAQSIDAYASVVGFDAGAMRITGPTGSGKTEALMARSHRLAATGANQRTLFIAAPSSVPLLRQRVEAGFTLGSAEITVHSFSSLVAAIYAFHGDGRHILDRATEQTMIAELLDMTPESTIVRRVTRARRAYVESWLGEEELTTHLTAADSANQTDLVRRWQQVVDLTEVFASLCLERGAIDRSSAIVEATLALRVHAAQWRKTYPHIVFDDFESATFAQYRMAMTLASPALTLPGSVVLSGDLDGPSWGGPFDARWLTRSARSFAVDRDVVLSRDSEFAGLTSAAPLETRSESITVRHRSLRGSAIVSELIRLLEAGLSPSELAVIIPEGSAGYDVAESIAAAAARQAVQVSRPSVIGDDPVARAVMAGAESILTASPWPESLCALGISEAPPHLVGSRSASSLVFALWKLLAPRLLRLRAADAPATSVRTSAGKSSEVLRSFHDAVRRAEQAGTFGKRALQHGQNSLHSVRGGIEILTESQVRGRRWSAVIVTGYEEGTRPPHPRPPDYFDLELLHGPDVPEVNERQRRILADSQKLSDNLLARGTRYAIAVTAPEPGVLRSRFLEKMPSRDAARSTPTRRSVVPLEATQNDYGFWHERQIRASASSLDTFRNCPLEYTYKYVLGIATASGPQAMVGTITHDILERFFDPTSTADRSPDRLRELFDERWNDDDFPYLAQAAEYRATVWAMLENVLAREALDPAQVLHVEYPFAIPLGDYTLSGKIDRIDIHQTATRTVLGVVDYKTGAAKHGAAADSLQLGVYFLAVKRDPTLAEIGEPTSLALHFLKTDELQHQLVHSDLEQEWEALILDTLQTIATGEHAPSAEASCAYCEFGRVCPTQPAGRVVPVTIGRP
jgi:RecB family exonuclease